MNSRCHTFPAATFYFDSIFFFFFFFLSVTQIVPLVDEILLCISNILGYLVSKSCSLIREFVLYCYDHLFIPYVVKFISSTSMMIASVTGKTNFGFLL